MDNIKQRIQWMSVVEKQTGKKLYHDMGQAYFIYIHCRNHWISTYNHIEGCDQFTHMPHNLPLKLQGFTFPGVYLLTVVSTNVNRRTLLLDCKSEAYFYYLSYIYKSFTHLNTGSYFTEIQFTHLEISPLHNAEFGF